MVQKRVPAQGWLGSTPEGQRPQIRGLRAGGSLAVASSIPATQLSSPARLAERVVTPHAPMTLGANHGSRAPERGRPGRCWCSPAWPPGPRQGWATGFDSSPRADNTSVRAGGILSVGIPRFLNKSQHFTVHLFRPWRPGSARGSDGGPRRFTEVVPTLHAYSGQWPVKTKRARARSCASVVTRKRPSLNRAKITAWFKSWVIQVTVRTVPMHRPWGFVLSSDR